MHHHYHIVAKAIEYISSNFRQQPELEEIAAHVHISAGHLQRIFTEWAGISPKQFLKYISAEYAASLLQKQSTLFDTAIETGLSGTGRLHDLFITIQAMTPAEYKHGGSGLSIEYSMHNTPFGDLFIASTTRGICYAAFADHGLEAALKELQIIFPQAVYMHQADNAMHHKAAATLNGEQHKVDLHIKGTPFQIQIWQALLNIKSGNIISYAGLAELVGNARAQRAAGTAVGANPVAMLIPCHRVILTSGKHGNYHWGSLRKTLILGREAALIHGNNSMDEYAV
jgi:AraC family transcriptional regulator of adaptative response/methylated-DNA-[protein]-cysteine methyltransferase